MGPANSGQQPFAEIFPGIPNPQSTGAGSGSAGTTGAAQTPQAAQASAPAGAALGQIDLSTTAGLSGAAGIPQTIAVIHANDTGEPSQTLGYKKSLITGGQDMSTTTSGQNKGGPYSAAHIIGPRGATS